VTALVEEESAGRHDVIFGTPFLNDLGLKFDYNRGTIVWDDVATTMKTITTESINSLNGEDPGDTDLSAFMKTATKKAATTFKANNYEKYNYRDMVLKCTHLSPSQQDTLIDLFSSYEELFNGNLGSVPGPPVSLKLKTNAKPFAARAYTVPKALESIAKKELFDLVNIGVLVKGIHSEWASSFVLSSEKRRRCSFCLRPS